MDGFMDMDKNCHPYLLHSICQCFSLLSHIKFPNFLNRPSEKRVSAVALSNDSLYVCFADKFGVIWVVDLDGFDGNQMLVDKKAAPLLAHYCSIITSLVSIDITAELLVIFKFFSMTPQEKKKRNLL